MLRALASKHDAFRLLGARSRLPYEEVWHLWTVVMPRRSITGRLLWGTVLRRRDDGRWIYKQYTPASDDTPAYRASARTLVRASRRSLSQSDAL